jgi:hypothetical protein
MRCNSSPWPIRGLLPALGAALAALPPSAWATTVNPVPEPSSWWLAGIAAVAAIVVTIRNRRK